MNEPFVWLNKISNKMHNHVILILVQINIFMTKTVISYLFKSLHCWLKWKFNGKFTNIIKKCKKFAHRGRYAAPAGRRPKPAADQPERFVVDDEEVTLRPPPKKKAREQKRGHDLMASVAQNKPGSKKH